MALTAADIIAQFKLQPHPEGGHYRETFRDPHTDAKGRSVSTAILMILEMDQPFAGLLQIPTAPLTSAVEEMRR